MTKSQNKGSFSHTNRERMHEKACDKHQRVFWYTAQCAVNSQGELSSLCMSKKPAKNKQEAFLNVKGLPDHKVVKLTLFDSVDQLEPFEDQNG